MEAINRNFKKEKQGSKITNINETCCSPISAHTTIMTKRSSSKTINFEQCCKKCVLQALCLAKNPMGAYINSLNEIAQHPSPLQKNEFFYRQGDKFKALYIVRSGAIKTYYINKKGEMHVTGFYFPGELFGLDGFTNMLHSSFAIALDTSSVCKISYHKLEKAFQLHPELQRKIMATLCTEIYGQQQLLLSLRQKHADQCLATFLINLSHRQQQRGLSATELLLPMSRQDLAAYLGMAGETMSRLFTRFQEKGWLAAHGHYLTLLNVNALDKLTDTIS